MNTIPPLSDNLKQFLQAVEAGLERHDLNLGVNFGLCFTDPDADHGIGAMFCQLNMKLSKVSFKRAKETLIIATTRGIVVNDTDGNDQIMSFTDKQPPWMIGSMVAGALTARKPIVAPTCPHCLAEREQAAAS